MARSDAKGVLERLVERLEFAVRTRPKPKRGAWTMLDKGGMGGKSEKGAKWMGWGRVGAGRELMESFVGRGKGKGGGVVGKEEEGEGEKNVKEGEDTVITNDVGVGNPGIETANEGVKVP